MRGTLGMGSRAVLVWFVCASTDKAPVYVVGVYKAKCSAAWECWGCLLR